jgi:pimeloyl-ACP methyl ester carboxylesterase
VLTLPGFAGQPRIAGPLVATMRDAIAAYIVDHKLDHPVIVGHSLGGDLALELASAHPDLIGRLVIVDSLPFLAAAFMPGATVESARGPAEQMRQAMASPNPDPARQRAMIESMVTRPADLDRVLAWGKASDRGAVADAMYELMTTDLRDEVAKITAPTLVIGTWQGRPGASRAEVEPVFTAQYAKLRGAQIVYADHARHFVMLDDPQFLFAQLDQFLTAQSARR